MTAYQTESESEKFQKLLPLFYASRMGIDIFTNAVIESVKGGHANPLKIRVWCKAMEISIERIIKETIAEQLTAAEKFNETKFNYSGAEITKGDIYTAYDYSTCHDPIHARLKKTSDEAKQQLSDRESFLKTIKQPITIVDEATGEVSTLSPPLKKSTAGLKVSIR